MKPLYLLEKEDVHRDGHASKFAYLCLVLVLDVVLGQARQEVGRLFVHDVLPRHAPVSSATLGLSLAESPEQGRGLLHAVRQVRVRVEAEYLRRVVLWKLLDVFSVISVFREGRHGVAEIVRYLENRGFRIEGVALLARQVGQPLLRVGTEQSHVQAVGDLAAVLDVGDHVPESAPVDLAVVEVLLQEEHAALQVAVVVFVRDAPAQGPELPPLLDDAVEEAQREEELPPLRGVDPLQAVLVDHHPGGVAPQKTRAKSGGRVVGHLRAHLEQAEGEVGMRQRRDEQSKVGVDASPELVDDGLHLIHQAEAELAVLQQDPRPVHHARVDGLERHRLLPLAKRYHGRGRELLLPAELDYPVGRVGPPAQEEDNRDLGHHVVVDHFDRVSDRLDEGRPHLFRIADELLAHQDAPVDSEAADEQQLEEGTYVRPVAEPLLVSGRDRHGLGRVVVVPLAPSALARRHVLDKARVELVALAKLRDVEPNLVAHPLERLLPHAVDVEGRAAPQEESDVAAPDVTGGHEDLERHEEDERQLVLLVQAPVDVAVGHVRHGLDDVGDTLARQGRRRSSVHGPVEQLQELGQARLVHDIDQAHFDDAEVEHGPPGRRGPELLALLGDAGPGLVRRDEFGVDLRGLGLGVRKDGDELLVVQQIARVARQALEEAGVEQHQTLRVGIDLLEHLGQLLLEGLLLLADHLAEQLLLEALLGHGEVDESRLGLKLGAEARVGEPRDEVQLEIRIVVHHLVAHADVKPRPLLGDLLLEDRVEHGVDLVLHAHNDQALPVAHAVLQLVLELGVGQLNDVLPVPRREMVALLVFDPAQRLALGVDQEREPRAARHQDPVLRGQRVGGQAVHVPVAYRAHVGEERYDVEVAGDGHVARLAVRRELLVDQIAAELLVEGAAVAHEGAPDRAVANETLLLVAEVGGVLGPPGPFAGKAVDQRRRLIHLLLQSQGALLDALLLPHLLVELVLQASELLVARGQPSLGGGKGLVGGLHLSLGNGERLELGLDDLARLVVVLHGPHVRAQSLRGRAGVLGNRRRELLYVDVHRQELDRLVVHQVLAGIPELDELAQEVRAAHHLESLLEARVEPADLRLGHRDFARLDPGQR